MKNLYTISEASKHANFKRPLSIYYDFSTDEVLTDELIQLNGNRNYFKCTELIRECSAQEIESYVYRALWM